MINSHFGHQNKICDIWSLKQMRQSDDVFLAVYHSRTKMRHFYGMKQKKDMILRKIKQKSFIHSIFQYLPEM